MKLGLNDKTAIVSAASRGLGRACAESLAREGVDVTIMARNADVLEATAQEIADTTGRRITPVAGDFNSTDDRARLFDACPAPDILVNNPGVRQTPAPYDEIDRDIWLQWLNDHFLSSITMIQ